MPIKVTLNVVMAQRNVKSKELAAYIGMSEQNLSILKTGKIKGMRFSTLEKICEYLKCKPGDIMDYEEE
ncbi:MULTISPECIES: helix-turn-helix domain-containing protein [Kordiimonas]|uniref:helix-turn-helix domain-containing protein n=1 Tax=Kordiimonas TaxID=288021 RepID=UPI001FF349BA|nr:MULTISPECIES: helix-turn-helix transcriptional regulator [Kordiimonas]MCK0069648.1 helix-turn-helix transcriptional regulator [Kordiimonas laminariae]UTW57112.1 helix-turn-helix transcriptional regulator [Kordiimonas sp. SCSIO 12603]